MSKPRSDSFDRRLAARLLAAGEPTVLVAELLGLPRLELEAARTVDPELAALERYYAEIERWPAARRRARARKLFLIALEHALERGEIRGLGWAARLLAAGAAEMEEDGEGEEPPDEVAAVERTLSPEERAIWDALDYARWPVPPVIPPEPGAPPAKGPLEVPNDAGSEAERLNEPIPWPPKASGAEPSPAPARAPSVAADEARGQSGKTEPTAQARWPPHLRPL